MPRTDAPGMGPDGRTIYPGSVNPVFSPKASQIAKKVDATPKSDEDAKELHMFVWSANASPVSEGGLHVFGGNDHTVAAANVQPNSFDPKEVRMLVHPHNDPHVPSTGKLQSTHLCIILHL